MIGLVWVKFCGRIDAGGDGGDAGPDGACAANISGCIADDPDGLCVELFLEACLDVQQGIAGDIIAVGVVVTVGAAGEEVIDLEVSEFDPGALGVVAGEQAEVDVGELAEFLEEWLDTGEEATGEFVEAVWKSFEVGEHEAAALFGRVRDTVSGEDFVFDAAVGSSGGVNFFEGFGDAEFVTECEFHGTLSGAAGSEHGAIDIEEEDGVGHE